MTFSKYVNTKLDHAFSGSADCNLILIIYLYLIMYLYLLSFEYYETIYYL